MQEAKPLGAQGLTEAIRGAVYTIPLFFLKHGEPRNIYGGTNMVTSPKVIKMLHNIYTESSTM